jgi:tetratricopeptide (TPR) repeat protein
MNLFKKITLQPTFNIKNLVINHYQVLMWRIFIFVLFVILCTLKTKAQQTIIHNHPNNTFQKAIELFNKEKFAAAQQLFEQFAAQTQEKDIRINAEYYAAVCAMELFNADAENKLFAIINNYPEHVKAKLTWYQLAKFYYRKKNNQAAINCFEKFNDKYLTPDEEKEYYFTKGYCLFKVERYKDAENAFEKIKDVKSKYYEPANYYYAYVLYKNCDYQKSLEHFERVKKNKTFGPLATVYIAQIYFVRKDYNKVIQYCDTISNKDIADDVAGMLAQSYFELGNYEKAIPYMERFISSSPIAPSDHDFFRMGYAYYFNNNYTGANEYFLKINSRTDSLGQYANFYLGSTYLKLNKKQQAITAFNTAHQINIIDSITMLSLFYSARLSEELNQITDALNKYVKFLNDYDESELADEARSSLSNLLLIARNYKEALRILDGIKKQGLKEKIAIQRICYYRAEELYLNNDYNAAEEMFKRSLQQPLDKKLEGLSYFWLAEIATKRNQYTQAVELLNKAQGFNEIKQTRFYMFIPYNIGYAYLKLDQFDKASDAFKDYIAMDAKMQNPEVYTDALTRLADCYFVLKKYDKAIDNYSLIITKNLAGSDYALYQKSLIYGVLNQNLQKEQTLLQLTSNYPKSIYIDDAIYELASLYLQTEDYNRALDAFDNLINNYPLSAFIRKAMLNKGLVLYNQGKDQAALDQFKELIKSYPNSAESREALVVIKNIFVNKGEADEYLEFIKVLPNVVVAPSVQDSLTFESAFNAYKANDCAKAAKAFGNYITKFPGGFFILKANYFKAECEFKLKRYDEALAGYEYVANNIRNDYSERSTRQAAVIYYMKKKYEQAYQYYASLERIAGNKDNLQIAITGMMRCADFMNKPDTAAAVAFKFINAGFTNKETLTEAKLHIARFYMSRNQPDSALPEFTYILKETKNVYAAEAKYNIAYIQYLKKDTKSATKTIFELNESFSAFEEWRVKGFILLSDIYVQNNEYFQAKATLQSIIENYDGEPLQSIAKQKLTDVIALEEAKKEADRAKIDKRIQQKTIN